MYSIFISMCVRMHVCKCMSIGECVVCVYVSMYCHSDGRYTHVSVFVCEYACPKPA